MARDDDRVESAILGVSEENYEANGHVEELNLQEDKKYASNGLGQSLCRSWSGVIGRDAFVTTLYSIEINKTIR